MAAGDSRLHPRKLWRRQRRARSPPRSLTELPPLAAGIVTAFQTQPPPAQLQRLLKKWKELAATPGLVVPPELHSQVYPVLAWENAEEQKKRESEEAKRSSSFSSAPPDAPPDHPLTHKSHYLLTGLIALVSCFLQQPRDISICAMPSIAAIGSQIYNPHLLAKFNGPSHFAASRWCAICSHLRRLAREEPLLWARKKESDQTKPDRAPVKPAAKRRSRWRFVRRAFAALVILLIAAAS